MELMSEQNTREVIVSVKDDNYTTRIRAYNGVLRISQGSDEMSFNTDDLGMFIGVLTKVMNDYTKE